MFITRGVSDTPRECVFVCLSGCLKEAAALQIHAQPPIPHPWQATCTSTAAAIGLHLEAVSTEAEGPVPGHDAAVATAQLVAAWQQL